MPTKLMRWMRDNRFSDRLFAMELEKANGEKVSPRTIQSWRTGRAMPRRKALEAIKIATKGEVEPNDFIESAA